MFYLPDYEIERPTKDHMESWVIAESREIELDASYQHRVVECEGISETGEYIQPKYWLMTVDPEYGQATSSNKEGDELYGSPIIGYSVTWLHVDENWEIVKPSKRIVLNNQFSSTEF
jgi:hypothetical protein